MAGYACGSGHPLIRSEMVRFAAIVKTAGLKKR